MSYKKAKKPQKIRVHIKAKSSLSFTKTRQRFILASKISIFPTPHLCAKQIQAEPILNYKKCKSFEADKHANL